MQLGGILRNEPPTLSSILALKPTLTTEQAAAELEATLDAYAIENTRLYELVVKPSIEHTSSWASRDCKSRDASFDHGGVKDGRGYFQWLLPKTDYTSYEDQAAYRERLKLKLSPPRCALHLLM